jgi:trehalose-phosphatase
MDLLWSQCLSRQLCSLGAARHLLVCADFDGTLAPIAPRPEQAILLPGAFDLLHQLARLPDTHVAIVSGRSQDNLRAQSGLDWPILLVGSHGAELPGHMPGGEVESQSTLNDLEARLVSICSRSSGAWLERKPLGIAVHVRAASRTEAEQVLEAVRNLSSEQPALCLTNGKAVIELSLSRHDKGDAVQWLRDHCGTNPQVLYLGDDVTDENAFAALGPMDVGVKVGSGPTRAKYRVDSERAALGTLTFLWRNRASLAGHRIAPRWQRS